MYVLLYGTWAQICTVPPAYSLWPSTHSFPWRHFHHKSRSTNPVAAFLWIVSLITNVIRSAFIPSKGCYIVPFVPTYIRIIRQQENEQEYENSTATLFNKYIFKRIAWQYSQDMLQWHVVLINYFVHYEWIWSLLEEIKLWKTGDRWWNTTILLVSYIKQISYIEQVNYIEQVSYIEQSATINRLGEQ